jgi:hypothetical protein
VHVSEERLASIFSVEEQAKQETISKQLPFNRLQSVMSQEIKLFGMNR